MTNALGQVVFSKRIRNTIKEEINLQVPNGVYYVSYSYEGEDFAQAVLVE